MASRNPFATALVLDQLSAPKGFGEIGTHALGFLLGHSLGLGASVSCRQCSLKAAADGGSAQCRTNRGAGPGGHRLGRRGGEGGEPAGHLTEVRLRPIVTSTTQHQHARVRHLREHSVYPWAGDRFFCSSWRWLWWAWSMLSCSSRHRSISKRSSSMTSPRRCRLCWQPLPASSPH